MGSDSSEFFTEVNSTFIEVNSYIQTDIIPSDFEHDMNIKINEDKTSAYLSISYEPKKLFKLKDNSYFKTSNSFCDLYSYFDAFPEDWIFIPL